MIRLEPLEDRDFEAVERWNRGKSHDFLVISETGPWGLMRMKITNYDWKAAEGC